MFKLQSEFTPVIIEDENGSLELVYLIVQEENLVRLCKRLLKTKNGFLPVDVGFCYNHNIKTITKLEVKNEHNL